MGGDGGWRRLEVVPLVRSAWVVLDRRLGGFGWGMSASWMILLRDVHGAYSGFIVREAPSLSPTYRAYNRRFFQKQA